MSFFYYSTFRNLSDADGLPIPPAGAVVSDTGEGLDDIRPMETTSPAARLRILL